MEHYFNLSENEVQQMIVEKTNFFTSNDFTCSKLECKLLKNNRMMLYFTDKYKSINILEIYRYIGMCNGEEIYIFYNIISETKTKIATFFGMTFTYENKNPLNLGDNLYAIIYFNVTLIKCDYFTPDKPLTYIDQITIITDIETSKITITFENEDGSSFNFQK
jgi:hypothetical protein